MKIVYLSNSIIPSRLANSVHVMEMCQAFAKNGHEVALFAPDSKSNYEFGVEDIFGYYGVDRCFELVKLPFPNMKGKGFVYLAACSAMLKRYKPDLVFGRSIEGCLLAALIGHQTIIDLHAPIWESRKILYFFMRRLLNTKNVIKITVNSGSLKKMLIEKNFLRVDAIQVARNGSKAIEDSEPMANWRGRSGVLQVGYIGHLYKGRGINLILNCAEKIPEVDFHIIGGMEQDISYWNSKPKGGNVFFHGYVHHSIVHKYRNSCHVLLAPYEKKVCLENGKTDSSKYMSPIKIIEYMSSRKAIIASDMPPIREVLNESNSILVESQDIEGWVKAIKCLQAEKRREILANNAYKDFLSLYTWQKRAKAVLNE